MSKQQIEVAIVDHAYARASKFGKNWSFYLDFYLAFYSANPSYVMRGQ